MLQLKGSTLWSSHLASKSVGATEDVGTNVGDADGVAVVGAGDGSRLGVDDGKGDGIADTDGLDVGL